MTASHNVICAFLLGVANGVWFTLYVLNANGRLRRRFATPPAKA